jgi:hypothetical protein
MVFIGTRIMVEIKMNNYHAIVLTGAILQVAAAIYYRAGAMPLNWLWTGISCFFIGYGISKIW